MMAKATKACAPIGPNIVLRICLWPEPKRKAPPLADQEE
jgi:hypothetical protein